MIVVAKLFVTFVASDVKLPIQPSQTMLRRFVTRACGVDVQRLQRERARGLQIAKPVLVMNGERL